MYTLYALQSETERVSPLHLVNPFQQGGQKFVIGKPCHLLPFLKQHPPAVAAGNADVRFPGLPGAVDNAAHDRYGNGLLAILQGFVHLIHKTDQVNPGSATGGTRDDVHALLPKSRRLENVLRGVDLLDGIVCQAYPEGISNAI